MKDIIDILKEEAKLIEDNGKLSKPNDIKNRDLLDSKIKPTAYKEDVLQDEQSNKDNQWQNELYKSNTYAYGMDYDEDPECDADVGSEDVCGVYKNGGLFFNKKSQLLNADETPDSIIQMVCLEETDDPKEEQTDSVTGQHGQSLKWYNSHNHDSSKDQSGSLSSYEVELFNSQIESLGSASERAIIRDNESFTRDIDSTYSLKIDQWVSGPEKNGSSISNNNSALPENEKNASEYEASLLSEQQTENNLEMVEKDSLRNIARKQDDNTRKVALKSGLNDSMLNANKSILGELVSHKGSVTSLAKGVNSLIQFTGSNAPTRPIKKGDMINMLYTKNSSNLSINLVPGKKVYKNDQSSTSQYSKQPSNIQESELGVADKSARVATYSNTGMTIPGSRMDVKAGKEKSTFRNTRFYKLRVEDRMLLLSLFYFDVSINISRKRVKTTKDGKMSANYLITVTKENKETTSKQKERQESQSQVDKLWHIEKSYEDFQFLMLHVKNKLGGGNSASGNSYILPIELPRIYEFVTNDPKKSMQLKNKLEEIIKEYLTTNTETRYEVLAFLSSDLVANINEPKHILLGRKEGYLVKKGKNFGRWVKRYYMCNISQFAMEYYDKSGGKMLGKILLSNAVIYSDSSNFGKKKSNSSYFDRKNFCKNAFCVEEKLVSGKSSFHVFWADSDQEHSEWVVCLEYIVNVIRFGQQQAESTVDRYISQVEGDGAEKKYMPLLADLYLKKLPHNNIKATQTQLLPTKYSEQASNDSSFFGSDKKNSFQSGLKDTQSGSVKTQTLSKATSTNELYRGVCNGLTKHFSKSAAEFSGKSSHSKISSVENVESTATKRSEMQLHMDDGNYNLSSETRDMDTNSTYAKASVLSKSSETEHAGNTSYPNESNLSEPKNSSRSPAETSETKNLGTSISAEKIVCTPIPGTDASMVSPAEFQKPKNPSQIDQDKNNQFSEPTTNISSKEKLVDNSYKDNKEDVADTVRLFKKMDLTRISAYEMFLFKDTTKISYDVLKTPMQQNMHQNDTGTNKRTEKYDTSFLISGNSSNNGPGGKPSKELLNKHSRVFGLGSRMLKFGAKLKSSGQLLFKYNSSNSLKTCLSKPGMRRSSSGSTENSNKLVAGVFGVEFGIAAEKTKIRSDYNIPAIVYRCIEYLDENRVVFEKDIYLAEGDPNEVKELTDQFNILKDYNLLHSPSVYKNHSVANVLKQYLRSLPENILTIPLLQDFADLQTLTSRTERVEKCGKLLQSLPISNFTLLRALLGHLIRIVLNNTVNNMTLRKMSNIISPILRIPVFLFVLFAVEYKYLFNIGKSGSPSPTIPDPLPPEYFSEKLQQENGNRNVRISGIKRSFIVDGPLPDEYKPSKALKFESTNKDNIGVEIEIRNKNQDTASISTNLLNSSENEPHEVNFSEILPSAHGGTDPTKLSKIEPYLHSKIRLKRPVAKSLSNSPNDAGVRVEKPLRTIKSHDVDISNVPYNVSDLQPSFAAEMTKRNLDSVGELKNSQRINDSISISEVSSVNKTHDYFSDANIPFSSNDNIFSNSGSPFDTNSNLYICDNINMNSKLPKGNMGNHFAKKTGNLLLKLTTYKETAPNTNESNEKYVAISENYIDSIDASFGSDPRMPLFRSPRHDTTSTNSGYAFPSSKHNMKVNQLEISDTEYFEQLNIEEMVKPTSLSISDSLSRTEDQKLSPKFHHKLNTNTAGRRSRSFTESENLHNTDNHISVKLPRDSYDFMRESCIDDLDLLDGVSGVKTYPRNEFYNQSLNMSEFSTAGKLAGNINSSSIDEVDVFGLEVLDFNKEYISTNTTSRAEAHRPNTQDNKHLQSTTFKKAAEQSLRKDSINLGLNLDFSYEFDSCLNLNKKFPTLLDDDIAETCFASDISHHLEKSLNSPNPLDSQPSQFHNVKSVQGLAPDSKSFLDSTTLSPINLPKKDVISDIRFSIHELNLDFTIESPEPKSRSHKRQEDTHSHHSRGSNHGTQYLSNNHNEQKTLDDTFTNIRTTFDSTDQSQYPEYTSTPRRNLNKIKTSRPDKTPLLHSKPSNPIFLDSSQNTSIRTGKLLKLGSR
ncbi:putative Rho-type GTPase-activating protein 2 [Zancudomyces culisetae]|uniref:Putative Rho-type GTPase-activating protein 2 n=1 Tax=Zancudomyces culisetae TaxID=1213189 RepID=A0A1R1PWX5_ZANCU|nr:putative Rho-type GTPase-activating protein 2 [Zancudomyces culisetae]|eukprot:OMH85496.1 putative Rho-type GTPase-activating protein 2 [Zancudomyces culisetae]